MITRPIESVLIKRNDEFLEYDKTTRVNSTVASSYSENSSFLLTKADSSYIKSWSLVRPVFVSFKQ